jgi:hypothetical protein
MSSEVAHQQVAASTARPAQAPRAAVVVLVPVLVLLASQVAVFVAMAGRGIDLTDESYYLLNFLHWRELIATPTFFGLYFEGPFRLLGQDVGAIRVFGLLLLMAAGALLTWRALVFSAGRPLEASAAAWALLCCGMAASIYYYNHVTTLRVPSYNLLVLVCVLLSTALLLVMTEGGHSAASLRAVAAGYGLVLGACALGKATSAVALVLFHAAFYLALDRSGRKLQVVACTLAGVAVNFILLTWLQANWFNVLRDGASLTVALDSRYGRLPLGVLGEAVLRGGQRLAPLLIFGVLLCWAAIRRWRHLPAFPSLLAFIVVGTVVLAIERQGYGKSWWALHLYAVLILWWAAAPRADAALGFPAPGRTAGLTMLLFAMPVAYSIGTNNSLPAHTQMASVFGVVAMLLPLHRLYLRNLLAAPALALCLAVLSVPMLVAQVRSLQEATQTYRLRTGLLEQSQPVALGARGSQLRVDGATRADLEGLAQALRSAGYTAGEPILDMTGDGPGLVYALDGRPVGVAWLLGGYPGTAQVAAWIVTYVPEATLRSAWVIAADDGHARRVSGWLDLLRQRLGEGSHQRVATLDFRPQYAWASPPPRPVMLSVWKAAGRITPEARP